MMFSTMATAEIRCKAQMAAKVWVVAHAARNMNGQIIARFQRYMSAGPQLIPPSPRRSPTTSIARHWAPTGRRSQGTTPS